MGIFVGAADERLHLIFDLKAVFVAPMKSTLCMEIC